MVMSLRNVVWRFFELLAREWSMRGHHIPPYPRRRTTFLSKHAHINHAPLSNHQIWIARITHWMSDTKMKISLSINNHVICGFEEFEIAHLEPTLETIWGHATRIDKITWWFCSTSVLKYMYLILSSVVLLVICYKSLPALVDPLCCWHLTDSCLISSNWKFLEHQKPAFGEQGCVFPVRLNAFWWQYGRSLRSLMGPRLRRHREVVAQLNNGAKPMLVGS